MKRLLSTVLVVVCLFASAHATTLLQLNWSGIVERSELIVEGRVLSVSSFRDAAGRVQSELLLQVDGSLRGAQSGESLRFTWPGGSFDGVGERIVGLPIPTPGQELLLFLHAESRGMRLPVGLSQGVLQRLRDPQTREVIYLRSLNDLTLVNPQGEPVAVPELAERFERDALLSELRDLVRSNDAPRSGDR